MEKYHTIKKIGLLTSGGDAPGMNAAVRAVVRTAIFYKKDCYGIMRGYQGMIEGEMKKLELTDVSNIIHRGGTILKTARSKDFITAEGRKKAYEQLKKNEIDALVLIGGDGTFRGASIFSDEYNIPVVGLPGTIDNDINGTDFTIGFDTALQTAVEAIDKIRDTAEAHDRVFLVEVMGRDAGYIALHSGLACGAEQIFVPEVKENVEDILNHIKNENKRKKCNSIIVIAEGDEHGGAIQIQERIKTQLPNIDSRVAILGHIQRGGSPTANDRNLASLLGYHAVLSLLQGKNKVMLGKVNHEIAYTAFAECSRSSRKHFAELIQMAEILAK